MIPALLLRSLRTLSCTVRHTLKQPALTYSLITAAFLAGCSTTSSHKDLSQSAAQEMTQLKEYKVKIAQKIQQENSPLLASGSPQSMLRSVVVMAFKVNKQGQLVSWSVYRTNGDAQAEQVALSSLQRAAPLPLPPSELFRSAGEIEIVEGWLFNDDGKFQIRTLASPQR